MQILQSTLNSRACNGAYVNFVTVVTKRSCRDVGNNDTYDVIYQKAADMVSPEEK